MSEVTCVECGSLMVKRRGKYGLFYGCSRYPDCTGIHGAHQQTGEPLGTPADSETRKARIAAHDAFDQLWKVPGRKRRSTAYHWLAEKLGIKKDDCHIGRFDLETCRRAEAICREKVKEYEEIGCVAT